jgi:hypothetical protein
MYRRKDISGTIDFSVGYGKVSTKEGVGGTVIVCKIHQTLRVTPAMQADLRDQLWSLEEIIQMADNYLPKPGKRGPYRKNSAA